MSWQLSGISIDSDSNTAEYILDKNGEYEDDLYDVTTNGTIILASPESIPDGLTIGQRSIKIGMVRTSFKTYDWLAATNREVTEL